MTYLIILAAKEWQEFCALVKKVPEMEHYLSYFEYEEDIGHVIELAKSEFCRVLINLEKLDRKAGVVEALKRLGLEQDPAFFIYLETLRRELARFEIMH